MFGLPMHFLFSFWSLMARWRCADVVDESLCQGGWVGRLSGLLTSGKPRAGRRAADPAVDKLSRASLTAQTTRHQNIQIGSVSITSRSKTLVA
jgi:hypothetical protein